MRASWWLAVLLALGGSGGWAIPTEKKLSMRIRSEPPNAQIYILRTGAARVYDKEHEAEKPVGFSDGQAKVYTYLDGQSYLSLVLKHPDCQDRPVTVNITQLRGSGGDAWPVTGEAIVLERRSSSASGASALWALLLIPAGAAGVVFLRRRKPAPPEDPPEEELASALPTVPISVWDLPDGARIGPYRIRGRLGEGASAVVYRVSQEDGEPDQALKLLKGQEFRSAAGGVDVMARFRREMSALLKLHHPNIPYLSDVGEYCRSAYLVMELLRGPTLAERLKAGGLPLAEVRQIVGQLAEALAFAHRRGVLHRDVKPDNVVLSLDGKVRLTDFGLARSHDSTTLTTEGTMLGTPGYMAPELVQGERASEASDQYALGCLAFELVAGRPPFLGESPLAIAIQHIQADPPELAELRPEAPAELVAVVARMMAKAPEDRFSSLEAVRTALAGDAIPGI